MIEYQINNRKVWLTSFGVVVIFIAAYVWQIQRGNSPFAPTTEEATEMETQPFFIMQTAVKDEILKTFDYVSGIGIVTDTLPKRLQVSDVTDGIAVAIKDKDGNVLGNLFEMNLPADATVAEVAETMRSNLASFNLQLISEAFPDAFTYLDGDKLTAVLPLPDKILAFETTNTNYAFTKKLMSVLVGINGITEATTETFVDSIKGFSRAAVIS
ncbi:MAG: hypothetical protein PHO48_02605 [Candidatus Gracilibacteria bacterium]|nr:hypothetical protein [Candidatus Gracilibacteria bacterium]MDD5179428.1 hypothetical protein [Candidatus Gracilibacteria bacterium]